MPLPYADFVSSRSGNEGAVVGNDLCGKIMSTKACQAQGVLSGVRISIVLPTRLAVFGLLELWKGSRHFHPHNL